MAQTLSLMDSFRIFDRSNSGKVTIDDFVNGILEHLIQLRKNDETISEIAQSLYTDALSISQRNHGVGSNPITDEMLHLHVDSLLSIFVEAAEKLHSISLFSHFIAARLEIIRDQSDGTGISVVIISR